MKPLIAAATLAALVTLSACQKKAEDMGTDATAMAPSPAAPAETQAPPTTADAAPNGPPPTLPQDPNVTTAPEGGTTAPTGGGPPQT
jgi:hypothetical protein